MQIPDTCTEHLQGSGGWATDGILRGSVGWMPAI